MTELVSLPVFFLIWAEAQGWDAPDFHLMVCEFLERPSRVKLLMMPRGHAKSTLLAIYNAWRFYRDNQYRILHQGDQDKTARKCSRDTRAVLRRHPLTANLRLAEGRGDVDFWWTPKALDERNPSMQAAGILTNITSSRADEIQNDDVEVPKNIGTPEAREKLRYRLSEQIHIAVPDAIKLWVGTPHTHDSVYEDVKSKGADCLILPMFQKEFRFKKDENSGPIRMAFRPEYVFAGIGKSARLLQPEDDFRCYPVGSLWEVVTVESFNLLDCYAGALWPERFSMEEMAARRKECNTLNEWDSQYQLHAKPIGDVRLNPDYLTAYDCEPVLRHANGSVTMWLGTVQIVSAALRWDPSSGKLGSDVSGVALLLQDVNGRYYWHRAIGLQGPIAEFDEAGKVCGGQVWEICDLVERYHLGRVVVETNGIGGHNPTILRAALKIRKLNCGITEHHATGNKQRRILSAMEGPLTSGMIWAHVSVLDDDDGKDGPAIVEMRQFNPLAANAHDDYIDALTGALMDGPSHIGRKYKKPDGVTRDDWGISSGSHEATLAFD